VKGTSGSTPSPAEPGPRVGGAAGAKKAGRNRRVAVARRLVQASFLALFFFLAFRGAYPPLATPPSNLFLRFDPLAGLFALIAARSVSVFVRYWPAWVLLGLTVLSGRFFCGWICPLGTCFDAAGALKPKALRYYRPHGKAMKERLTVFRAGEAPRRLRIKYLLLALVLGLGIAGVNALYFASPLVVANRSIYMILLPQVPVFLLALLLLAFFYRPRFWCEEICPMGALMSLVSVAGKRLGARWSPLAVVKDSAACVECGGCYRECGFGVDEPYVKADSGRLRSADCTACGECVSACPSEGALALECFGVPLARSRGLAGSRRGRGTTDTAPTGQGAGGRLTVSRGEFIASAGLAAVMVAGYGAGLRAQAGDVLRMPGAQDEVRFLAECNRCLACARACPDGCLKPMGLEGGLQKLWTPRFVPREASCIFDQCDHACARVCPAGAITYQQPDEVRIGVARVNRRTCLGWRGEICLVCQERCRFNAVENRGLRPVVVDSACTGCGACEQTCPTEPASIFVVPSASTASTPAGGAGVETGSREAGSTGGGGRER